MATRRTTLEQAIERVRITHPCGRLLARPGWGRSRENSLHLTDHELWLVWRGRGWMADRHRRYELRPGFCVWMRPGGIYDAGVADDERLGFTYIHFRWPGDGPVPPEFLDLRDVDFFDATMRRIVELVGSVPSQRWGRPADVPAAVTWLMKGVLASVARAASLDEPADELTRKIRAVAAEMRDRPEQPIAVSQYAERCGVSPAHFSRRFRSIMGNSPQQYLIDRRIEQARHLLRESNLSITRIARQLGCGDVYQFSRQFHKRMGLSPTRYRNR